MDVGGYKSDISEFRLYCLNDEDIPAVSSIINGYWGAYQIRDEGGEDGSPAYDFISSRGRRIRLDEDKNLAIYDFKNTTKLAIFKNHRRADSPMPFCTLLYGEDFANEAKLTTKEIYDVSQLRIKIVEISDFSSNIDEAYVNYLKTTLSQAYRLYAKSDSRYLNATDSKWEFKYTVSSASDKTPYYFIGKLRNYAPGTDTSSTDPDSNGIYVALSNEDVKNVTKMSLREMNLIEFKRFTTHGGTPGSENLQSRAASFLVKFMPFNLMNVFGTYSKMIIESEDANLANIIGEYTRTVGTVINNTEKRIFSPVYKKDDIEITYDFTRIAVDNFKTQILSVADLEEFTKTGSMTVTLTSGSGSSAISGTATLRLNN